MPPPSVSEPEMRSAGQNCPDSLSALPVTWEFSVSIRGSRVSHHLRGEGKAVAYRLKADGCQSRLAPRLSVQTGFRRQRFKTILGNIVRPYLKSKMRKEKESDMA